MLFYVSKVFGFVTAPSNVAVLLVVFGVALLFTGRPRLGRGLACAGAIMLVLLGASPVPKIAMRILEDRFPIAAADGRVDGIVVLGGAASITRGQLAFNEAASRLVAAVGLGLKHPDAKLVFTGGDAGFFERGEETEAEAAAVLFGLAGIRADRLVLEDRSRNTRENALYTRDLVAPKAGERWLLVTSAFHMPRAIASFRAVGLALEPYPVDFRTAGQAIDYWRPFARASEAMRMADLAAKEWMGIVSYRLAGYTDELLPGSSPASPAASARR